MHWKVDLAVCDRRSFGENRSFADARVSCANDSTKLAVNIKEACDAWRAPHAPPEQSKEKLLTIAAGEAAISQRMAYRMRARTPFRDCDGVAATAIPDANRRIGVLLAGKRRTGFQPPPRSPAANLAREKRGVDPFLPQGKCDDLSNQRFAQLVQRPPRIRLPARAAI